MSERASAFDPNKLDPRPELIFQGLSKEEADKAIGLSRNEAGSILFSGVDSCSEVAGDDGAIDNGGIEAE